MQHNVHRLQSSVSQRVTGRSGGQGIARTQVESKSLSLLERVLVSYRAVRGLLVRSRFGRARRTGPRPRSYAVQDLHEDFVVVDVVQKGDWAVVLRVAPVVFLV